MQKCLSLLTKIEKGLAGTFIGLMTLFVIVDVLSREIFSESITWAQKASVYLMIWAGFMGAALMTEKAAHLRPEIADKLWKNKHLFYRIQSLLTFIFAASFCYFATLYVLETKDFGDKSVVLNIELWPLQVIIPYTFLSMAIRYLVFFIRPEFLERRVEENKK